MLSKYDSTHSPLANIACFGEFSAKERACRDRYFHWTKVNHSRFQQLYCWERIHCRRRQHRTTSVLVTSEYYQCPCTICCFTSHFRGLSPCLVLPNFTSAELSQFRTRQSHVRTEEIYLARDVSSPSTRQNEPLFRNSNFDFEAVIGLAHTMQCVTLDPRAPDAAGTLAGNANDNSVSASSSCGERAPLSSSRPSSGKMTALRASVSSSDSSLSSTAAPRWCISRTRIKMTMRKVTMSIMTSTKTGRPSRWLAVPKQRRLSAWSKTYGRHQVQSRTVWIFECSMEQAGIPTAAEGR